jgi:hypothetical protein
MPNGPFLPPLFTPLASSFFHLIMVNSETCPLYLSAKLSNESINAWLNKKLDRVVNEELKGCGA